MNNTRYKNHVVLWGMYDLGKPRVRMMREALANSPDDVVLHEIHGDVWGGIEDKSQISLWRKVQYMMKILLLYPVLIWKYITAPKHSTVVVGYMGLFDVLLLYPFAKLRRAKIIWDMFLSIYDTTVNDRKLHNKRAPVSQLLYFVEWLSCRSADKVILDTNTHAKYIAKLFNLPEEKVDYVHVGAEDSSFPPLSAKENSDTFNILFYGQFIPLHGVETIIRAAQKCTDPDICWTLIGKGQEAVKIQEMLEDNPVDNLTWLPWVAYDKLYEYIEQADVCLGIFGKSAKAHNVIPNKIFQALACGRPVITMQSAAINELSEEAGKYIVTVPPGSSDALLDSIYSLKKQPLPTAPISMSKENIKKWQEIVGYIAR